MPSQINASNSGFGGIVSTGDSSGVLQLQTTGTTALTIDTSQNVGIGLTPSAWATSSAIQMVGGQSYSKYGVTNNAYYDGTNYKYISTATANLYGNSGGAHIWFNAPSGTAGTNITFTQAMTLDSAGNLGIGTTSVNDRLHISSSGDTTFRQTKTGQSDWALQTLDSGVWRLYSYTAGAERMRVDSSGNLGLGAGAPAGVRIYSSGSDIPLEALNSSGTNQFNIRYFTAQIMSVETFHASGSNIIFRTNPSSGSVTERLRINDTGGLILAGSTAQKATGTTWSNPSDQRLKENIRDYTKGTAELMQVRVREWEYNGKGNTTEGMKGLGVVADEVMTVLPDTVETYNAKLNADDEEDTEIKKFDATEITWLLVKTVQEQQTIINDLKARIETLETK